MPAITLLLTTALSAAPAKTILAHFYYWYPTNAEICTHHAPPGHFDRSDINWWKGELRNAQYAGIDVLTLMYWDQHPWTESALDVLCRAIKELDAAGEAHPRVAMHLDGIETLAGATHESPVKLCDLRDPAAQERVLTSFVHFFRIFKQHDLLDLCFRRDGKLVAFVYRPEYGQTQSLADNSMIDLWHRRFREELGEDLYVVLESAFHGARHPGTRTDMHCTNGDNYYRWDAALHGPLLESREEFPIATIGPGFDPSGQKMPNPRIRDRRDGQTFRDDFEQALRWSPPWLVIETFN
ncbi:MAG: hypothetical protein HYU66_10575, partial [Armatimonadetes bacterium]|nr:hypothetical protein [Armatimonadota bacterium]